MLAAVHAVPSADGSVVASPASLVSTDHSCTSSVALGRLARARIAGSSTRPVLPPGVRWT